MNKTRNHIEKEFRDVIFRLPHREEDETYLALINARLKEVVLRYGSETPDNLNCIRHIEYGRAGGKYGLKFIDRDIMVSEIMEALKSTSLPDQILYYFPDLENEEWKAVIEFIVLLLKDIENPFGLLEVFEKKELINYSSSTVQRKLYSLFEAHNTQFAKEYLKFGRETSNTVLHRGMKLKYYIFISEMVREMESLTLHERIKSIHSINQQEWEAAVRIIVLIILTLESYEVVE